MKTAYIGLHRIADQVVTNQLERAGILAAAVALAAVQRVSLPTAPVEDVAQYYTHQVLSGVEACLGEFNENLVFDLARASRLARQFWFIRYRVAHPSATCFVPSSCSFFETLSGVPLHMDEPDVQFLNINKTAVLQLAAAASQACVTAG